MLIKVLYVINTTVHPPFFFLNLSGCHIYLIHVNFCVTIVKGFSIVVWKQYLNLVLAWEREEWTWIRPSLARSLIHQLPGTSFATSLFMKSNELSGFGLSSKENTERLKLLKQGHGSSQHHLCHILVSWHTLAVAEMLWFTAKSYWELCVVALPPMALRWCSGRCFLQLHGFLEWHGPFSGVIKRVLA